MVFNNIVYDYRVILRVYDYVLRTRGLVVSVFKSLKALTCT
jgi:hypothetical protein